MDMAIQGRGMIVQDVEKGNTSVVVASGDLDIMLACSLACLLETA